MTMPSWPEELIWPLREGYQQQYGDNRRLAQSEWGPPRARRGITNTTQTVPLTFWTTQDGRARFERFYIEDTNKGVLPFLMPDWGIDGTDLLTTDGVLLLTDEGDPIAIAATWAVMFGQSAPTITPMGLDWRIGFDVLILP